MRKFWSIAMIAAVGLSLCACSTATKEKLGLKKKAPNEFMVSSRAPLTLPPEYDMLPVGVENYYNNNTGVEGLSDDDQGLLEKISQSEGQKKLTSQADNELKKLKHE